MSFTTIIYKMKIITNKTFSFFNLLNKHKINFEKFLNDEEIYEKR